MVALIKCEELLDKIILMMFDFHNKLYQNIIYIYNKSK
jgi:hypothetical protein